MSETARELCRSKRLGFGRACYPCRKRKHRCDAVHPECSNCRSRGTVCGYSPKTATNKDIAPGQATVTEDSVLPPQPSPSLPSIGSRPVDGSQSTIRLPATPPATDPSNPTGYFGDSSAIKFMSLAQATERDSLTEDELYLPEDISTIYQSSPREELLQCLKLMPDRPEGNQLVDAYFARVHVLYPFVHETSFRSQYEQNWIDQSPQEIGWMAIVNMVFAYGCEFCPCPAGVTPVERALQFVERSKKLILYQAFKASSLQITQALLLLCHYLQGSPELNEAWNFFGLTIRSAMSIGLHINPEHNRTISPVEREIRKRIWWGCFVLDRTLSMKFGRPPSLALLDALDVDLPSEVDDQYITNFNQFPRQPGGHPARITAFIQTIGLSRVIDSVLGMIYPKGRKADTNTKTSMPVQQDFCLMGNMLLLEGQLESWWNGLPEHLTKASDLPDGIDLTRQRNVLYIRYVQLRLLILRPSVLLLGKTDFQDRFLRAIATECARRCVSCARETIQIVLQTYHLEQLHSIWYLLHYVFSSLGVLIAAQRVGLSAEKDWNDESLAKTLDEGMEFCRSSSQQSGVAHRYMMLLERHIGQLHENLDRNGSGTMRPAPNGNIVHQSDPVQDSFFYSGIDPGSGQGGFNPANVSMGLLPVDFAAFDWLSYDGWAI
ncbi:fungal-specific transcription factor domain-containing protein [Aspergillus californicus]